MGLALLFLIGKLIFLKEAKNEQKTSSSPHHNHRARKWFIFKIVLGVVAFLLITIAGIAYGVYRNVENSYQNSYVSSTQGRPTVNISNLHAMSILILKIGDASTNANCYASVLAVMNKDTKQMALVSIPVDTQLSNQTTTNQSFVKNGEAGAQNLVQNLFGLQVTKFVQVDVTKIGNLLTAVGEITVENSAAFTSGTYQFAQGQVTLNSAARTQAFLQAGQGETSERVMKVSLAVYQKIKANTSVKSLANLSYYQKIMNAFSSTIHTNIAFDEFQDIALNYNKALVNSKKLSLNTTTKNSVKTIVPTDLTTVKTSLAQMLK